MGDWLATTCSAGEDLYGGLTARRAGDSTRAQHSRGTARGGQPVAHDLPAGGVSGPQDELLLPLRKGRATSGAGQDRVTERPGFGIEWDPAKIEKQSAGLAG